MLNGTMTVGVVQEFFQYVNQTAEPLTQASYIINTFQSALGSDYRTFKLLDSEEEIGDTKTPVTLESPKGAIYFEHVIFSYTPFKLLMKDISFKVNQLDYEIL